MIASRFDHVTKVITGPGLSRRMVLRGIASTGLAASMVAGAGQSPRSRAAAQSLRMCCIYTEQSREILADGEESFPTKVVARICPASGTCEASGVGWWGMWEVGVDDCSDCPAYP